MKRLITLLTAFALTACATQSSLWGVYSTPTARASTATVPASETASPRPTDTFAPTETPTLTTTPPLPTQTLVQVSTPGSQEQPILYYAQSGDSLDAVAIRFGVEKSEITSPKILPQTGQIETGTLLLIPDRIETDTTPNVMLIPDSDIIFSASASDFDVTAFITASGGFLTSYEQWLTLGWTSGTDVLKQLARDNSANPRILLSLLEYESGWVYGKPTDMFREKYPMGYQIQDDDQGLYKQLQWAINQLFIGYYGWRTGTLTELTFPNGETLRIAPELNAGTVAIQYYFAQQHNHDEWSRILDPNSPSGFVAYFNEMFGNPWDRSRSVEPIFPTGVTQPAMVLPFESNEQWNLTSGPHGAWDRSGPLAAIDFAPASNHKGCDPSDLWVVSVAPGVVVRSDNGAVVVDLDGDGNEQTGWNLLYLHMAKEGRVQAGQRVNTDDHIGHPSCEGGTSTGRHLHFARKYNGEWIIANNVLPFVLSGWTVIPGEAPYKGTLTRGARVVTADPYGQAWSVIIRLPNE
jgi:murein DD-endopeptidase MepM/ murein hydrolase activator NlpD